MDDSEARLHDVFAIPKTNKYQRPDTPRQRQQDQMKMSSTPCAELRSTHSEPTQDTRLKTSTAIQFLDRSYPTDDRVWHHPNDMADTSGHGVHPWSWRNNTKHCTMTEKETNQHIGDQIDIPETQETTTSPYTTDLKETGRQTTDRSAELDSNTEEQCATPSYTDTTSTESTLILVANTLSHTAKTKSATIALVANKIPNTATTNRTALEANKIPNTANTNPIDAANTWRHLNPLADPLVSLKEDCYHTVINAYATNIIVGNKDSPGMESIFALQPTNWLHDAIITWWLGYWCKKTGGLSNCSFTRQGKRNQNKIDVQCKTFFTTPFFWENVLDRELRGAYETKYVDIFTCSKILIPVNFKLKHLILACIDFEQKRISWYDSIGEAHQERDRILFAWLTRERSFNPTTKFEPDKWTIDSGPPPDTQIPLQTNNYDCVIFV
jgi:Ulp1 family protease